MKVDRHVKISELIGKYDIETQEELADRLNAEGFQVTQATVSRDIRDMKLMKVPTQEGRQKYSMMHVTTMELTEKYMRVLKDGYLSMDIAQNLIVVKTVSGMAMAVAAAIDEMKWKEVVGCIAGDNTIMIVTRDMDNALELMEKIRRVVEKN